jgi:hypothetical protein
VFFRVVGVVGGEWGEKKSRWRESTWEADD